MAEPAGARCSPAGPAVANDPPSATAAAASTAPQTAPRRSASRRLSGSAPSPVPITGLSGRDAASLAPGGKGGRAKKAEQDGPLAWDMSARPERCGPAQPSPEPDKWMMAAYLWGEILAGVCMTSFIFHCCAGEPPLNVGIIAGLGIISWNL